MTWDFSNEKERLGATWCIQYFANGKRVRESIGPSKRQAELVLGKRKAEIREGRYFDVRQDHKFTVSSLLDRYLSEHALLHKRPRTCLRYAAAAKVLTAVFGKKLVKDVTPEDVHAFILHRREQGKAAATINGEIAVLSTMFTWANKLKLTTRHPCRGIGKLKANQKDRYLTHEEIQRVLSASTGDLRDMIILALGTGMRASEVLGLDRDHVNLKQAVAILPDTKNHDRRVVPLPPPAVETLQRRPLSLRELFPGWALDRLERNFARVVRDAGLAGVTFHTLRHTFASHAVMAGVDLFTVAKLLGHRTIIMVQRYAHLAPAHLQAATDQAARVIFAANVPQEVPHAAETAA